VVPASVVRTGSVVVGAAPVVVGSWPVIPSVALEAESAVAPSPVAPVVVGAGAVVDAALVVPVADSVPEPSAVVAGELLHARTNATPDHSRHV
jgi:hypothetical protein